MRQRSEDGIGTKVEVAMIDLAHAQRIEARRILLAVDETDASRRATEAAADLAQRNRGSVFVLHVTERQIVRRGVIATELREDAAELVNTVVYQLRRKGVDAEGQVFTASFGRVGPAIADAARQLESEVIVIGSHKRSRLRRLLFGGTGRSVLKRVRVPVLQVD